jgi:hypothetical protein
VRGGRPPERIVVVAESIAPSSRPSVAVVESAEDGLDDDSALLGRLDAPLQRGVVRERLMRARGVVVVEVFGEDPDQVGLAEHDDVVEALSADRANDSLDERVLPKRPWRDHDLFDSQVPETLLEVASVGSIPITDQILRISVKGNASITCCAIHVVITPSRTLARYDPVAKPRSRDGIGFSPGTTGRHQ